MTYEISIEAQRRPVQSALGLGSISISSYGAVPGVDSYALIQNIFDNEQSVFIPYGTYDVSDTLRPAPGQHIHGPGVLRADRLVTILDVGGADDLTLEGIGITHGVTSGWTSDFVPALSDEAGAADRVTLRNLRIFETNYFGVLVDSGSNAWDVDGCKIIRTGRDGVDIRGGYGHRIRGCYAEDSGDDAFVITNRRVGSTTYQVTDSSVIGCTIIRPGSINLGGSGIRIGGKGMVVSGNTILEPNRYGIAVSSLDADGATRPDDVVVRGNTVRGLNSSRIDAVACLMLRDVESLQSVGNVWDCQGDNASPVGSAWLLKNNPTGGAQNGDVESVGDRVVGAAETLRHENYNTKSFRRRGGRDVRCVRPTRWAQGASYPMGLYEVQGLEVVEPAGNAFFARDTGEPSIDEVNFSDLRIRSASTPTSAPMDFGADASKVTKAFVKRSNFNGAPAISFTACTRAWFDYDMFYSVVARGTATLLSGNTTTTVTFGAALSYAIDPRDVQVMPRTPIAFSVGTITSSGFIINVATAPGANVIFDWQTKEPLIRRANGTAA